MHQRLQLLESRFLSDLWLFFNESGRMVYSMVRETKVRWGIFVWPVGQNNKREPPIGLRIVPPICQKSKSFAYAQIVFHTERPVNAFGGDLGHILIALVCYARRMADCPLLSLYPEWSSCSASLAIATIRPVILASPAGLSETASQSHCKGIVVKMASIS